MIKYLIQIKKSLFISLGFVLCLYSMAYSDQPDFVKYERAKQHFKSGLVFYNNMKYLSSVEYFRQAVTMYPQYHTAREYLARAYRLAGYTEMALVEWNYLYEVSKDPAIKNKINSINYIASGKNRNELKNSTEYVLTKLVKNTQLRQDRFNHPTDVAVDNENNYYVTSFKTGNVVKISPSLKSLESVAFRGDSSIYGITYRNGIIAVTDFGMNRVYFLNKDLDIISYFGKTGYKKSEFNGPQGLCFDKNNNIYVVDSGNCRIQKFTSEGKFITMFGRKGKYDNQFNNPTDITCFENKLYITDTGNQRVCIFDLYGNYIKEIKNDLILEPRGINISANSLLISDIKSGLLKYNIEAEVFTKISDPEMKEFNFSRLICAVEDRYNNIIALDHNKETLTILTPVEQKYNNLDVNIVSVDTHLFPKVAIYINVNDVYGRPVYNLNKENFSVIEDSARLPNLYSGYFKKVSNDLTVIAAIDKSLELRNYTDEFSWALDFYLKKMNKNDRIRITGFNSDNWIINDFDWSRLRSLKASKESEYEAGRNIGKVLYNSVSELLKYNTKRGVLLFTSGKVSSDSFNIYSEDEVIDFARIHHIPIYIITIGNPDQILVSISQKTGGKAFNISKTSFSDNIYHDIKKKEEFRYLLLYSTYKTSEYKDWWSELKVEVNYQSRKGIEWGGYFVPNQ